MKKILFALSMLAFVVSALPQARGADVSMDFIYDNLSGGNWIDVEGYGYGWQPEVVVRDPNWRPYSDGYWAYTDYGWTWISYEDFGWATYHYGRWANLGDYGWTWFPGEDLDWGPAWVSWRTGGDYIGWAPLPPRGPGIVYENQPIGVNVDVTYDIGPEYYNFCDVRFIGEPVLRDRIIPPAQNITYITNTVNVTNIYVQNNIVYNYGPDYTVVNRYSSRPIQRLAIERSCERLAQEGRDRAAVVRAHARAVGVEDADDRGVDALLAVVGHRQRLGVALGLVVDAARADRVDVAPVGLRLRVDLRVAVDLGGRGGEEAGAVVLGQAERVVRAVGADLERVQRQPQVVDRARRGGEVVDEVDRLVDEERLDDVPVQERELGHADVLDVEERAGLDVVDADHSVPASEELVTEVRAQETGPSRNQAGGHGGPA